jgi:hypothetical protein
VRVLKQEVNSKRKKAAVETTAFSKMTNLRGD